MHDSVIDFWSYSSMTTMLRNPLAFKKKYILKVYDDLDSPSSILGKAGHKALEEYYKGKEIHEAIEAGLDLINNTSDSGVDWGKTGSRAKLIESYNQAINFYFEELPKYHEILGVEQGITTKCPTIDGQELPLPLKSFSDLIVRNERGEIEIVDHKFVRSYTDGDVDDFSHFVQAMFNFHTVWAEYGEKPARMIFNECKVSKNRDNTPQIQPYTMEFGDHMADFAVFYKLFNSCTKLVNIPDMVFLPNPNDIFDGQNTFEVFRSGVISVDRPVAVKHKTEQKTFVEKQFVPSAFDKVENENLSDEERIRLKLQEFGIAVEMKDTHVGPSVTQYTFKPSKGVSMSKIAKMGEDLAIALEAENVRIEAPIRGTSLVGVETPSKVRKTVELATQHYRKGTLQVPIGVDVYGEVHYKDLADMPHLLIAGATGSGKSVMLNVLIKAITEQMTAKELDLVLIDPKRVELSHFADRKHVKGEIIYEVEEAVTELESLVELMEERYKTLQAAGVRNISDYKGQMSKVVVVIDEFADLMQSGGKTKKDAVKAEITERDERGKPIMKYRKEVEAERPSAESLIVKLAQKARAVGIHLVLATQRPSADVVTGLLKANIPTKIAFSTTSQVNSKVILDEVGAEELTGKGDMLFADPHARGLKRLQGLYA